MAKEKEEEKKIEVPTFEDGTILKAREDPIYIIEGGKKRVFPDIFTFVKHGISGDEIGYVEKSVLEAIPDGPPIPQIVPKGMTPAVKTRLKRLRGQ